MPDFDYAIALALSALWARLSHHPDPRAWQEAEAALITLRRIARQMGDPVPPYPDLEIRWRCNKTEHAPAGVEALVRVEWPSATGSPVVEYVVNESCGEGDWSQSSDHRHMSPYVTHWQPLPRPPRGVKR